MARTYTAAAVYHSPYSPKCLLMPSCLNLMRPAAAAGFDMESAAGSVHVETVRERERERERERGREEELQRIPDVRSTIVSNKIRTCAQCTIQRGFRHLHSFSSSDLSLSHSHSVTFAALRPRPLRVLVQSCEEPMFCQPTNRPMIAPTDGPNQVSGESSDCQITS